MNLARGAIGFGLLCTAVGCADAVTIGHGEPGGSAGSITRASASGTTPSVHAGDGGHVTPSAGAAGRSDEGSAGIMAPPAGDTGAGSEDDAASGGAADEAAEAGRSQNSSVLTDPVPQAGSGGSPPTDSGGSVLPSGPGGSFSAADSGGSTPRSAGGASAAGFGGTLPTSSAESLGSAGTTVPGSSGGDQGSPSGGGAAAEASSDGLPWGGSVTGGAQAVVDHSLTGVETPASSCTLGTPPGVSDLVPNERLPDPFAMLDGTEVVSTDDWACRRAEILSLMQEYELGPKPPRPSSVTGSFSNETLTIGVSEGGVSMKFEVSISKPSGPGPFPAMIVLEAECLPIPTDVATITFDAEGMAASDAPRGRGRFYELYGSTHPAGSVMASAWGVSRIIDALESTPTAGIDPTHVGVTGCSRYGVSALVAGAFDARVALTLPQESGLGGTACWRIWIDTVESDDPVSCEVQPFYRDSFCVLTGSWERLPFDNHMLMGLVAPRGLLVIDNSAIEWLGDVASYSCGVAGQRIFQALGVGDAMGYSQLGNGDHCRFPDEQRPELTAYIDKYLLSGDGEASVMRTDGNYGFDEARWVDWDTPELQ